MIKALEKKICNELEILILKGAEGVASTAARFMLCKKNCIVKFSAPCQTCLYRCQKISSTGFSCTKN